MLYAVGPLTSHSSQQVRRFPGFSFGYGSGKRTEQKFQPSKNCQQFMNKQFDEVCMFILSSPVPLPSLLLASLAYLLGEQVCRLVMKNKNSRSTLILQTLLTLLPRIAALNSELFALKYVAMTFLLMMGGGARNTCFLTTTTAITTTIFSSLFSAT